MRRFGGVLACLIGGLLALLGGGCLVMWLGAAFSKSVGGDWQTAVLFGGISLVTLAIGAGIVKAGIGMVRDGTGSGG